MLPKAGSRKRTLFSLWTTFSVDDDLVDFGCTTRFLSDGVELSERCTLRFLPSDRLSELLALAGFGRIEWFGDWNGSTFNQATSQEIIVIAHNG